MESDAAIEALVAWLEPLEGVAVAVSGGIDSLMLSTVAGRTLGARAGIGRLRNRRYADLGIRDIRSVCARISKCTTCPVAGSRLTIRGAACRLQGA